MNEYQEPLTTAEKKAVLSGVCPFHSEQVLDQSGPYVWCPLSDDEDEFGDSMGTATCKFFTTREWIKYQTGKDPWHFEIKPLRRKRT